MRITHIMLLGFACVCGLLLAQQGHAAIYEYTDKNGAVTFTDDLQAVPEEYRTSVKIVRGEEIEKSSPHPARGRQPEGPAGSLARDTPSETSSQKKSDGPGALGFVGGKELVTAVVVVSGAFLIGLLGTFDADYKKAVKVGRLIILWGVSVYLLVAHSGDVVRVVKKISGGIESAKQGSEEKGKKAAQAVKDWSRLPGPAEHPPTEGAAPETEHKE